MLELLVLAAGTTVSVVSGGTLAVFVEPAAVKASLALAATGVAINTSELITNNVETKQISIPQVQVKEKEGNKGPYSVKVQFQGPSIKGNSRTSGEGCVEVNLRSNKPIPASAVGLAVSEKYSSLSKKEQEALAGSYNKVMARIENAAKNGGCGPDYKSFQSNTGKPGDRCDFLTTGEINLVP